MVISNYTQPKSSFLSLEKDLEIITQEIMKNDRIKKMLYYTTEDCMSRPNLTQEETIGLLGKQIKIVPKLTVDESLQNYIIISFDNFIENNNNPQFRDNVIMFDVICHLDQWKLKDFQMRPYRIAAELDVMLKNVELTGIGRLEFLGARHMALSKDYAGVCLMYQAIHGGEDQSPMLDPEDQAEFEIDFNNLFNLK